MFSRLKKLICRKLSGKDKAQSKNCTTFYKLGKNQELPSYPCSLAAPEATPVVDSIEARQEVLAQVTEITESHATEDRQHGPAPVNIDSVANSQINRSAIVRFDPKITQVCLNSAQQPEQDIVTRGGRSIVIKSQPINTLKKSEEVKMPCAIHSQRLRQEIERRHRLREERLMVEATERVPALQDIKSPIPVDSRAVHAPILEREWHDFVPPPSPTISHEDFSTASSAFEARKSSFPLLVADYKRFAPPVPTPSNENGGSVEDDDATSIRSAPEAHGTDDQQNTNELHLHNRTISHEVSNTSFYEHIGNSFPPQSAIHEGGTFRGNSLTAGASVHIDSDPMQENSHELSEEAEIDFTAYVNEEPLEHPPTVNGIAIPSYNNLLRYLNAQGAALENVRAERDTAVTMGMQLIKENMILRQAQAEQATRLTHYHRLCTEKHNACSQYSEINRRQTCEINHLWAKLTSTNYREGIAAIQNERMTNLQSKMTILRCRLEYLRAASALKATEGRAQSSDDDVFF